MPSGYRGLAFTALVAALLLAFGLGAYFTGLPNPKQGYQPYQDSKANEGRPLSTVANVAAPVMERTPCNKPQSEGESDLCAQWRAAQAAEKSANWTVYGFWATLAGISLLIWQLILTRQAVNDTGEATKAMQISNDIVSESSAKQLRAYLAITSFRIVDALPGKTAKFEVIVTNKGQTPANDVRIFSFGGLMLKKNAESQPVHFPRGGISVGPIAPGDRREHWSEIDGWNDSDIDRLTDGEIVAVFAGVVTYRDMKRVRRYVMFNGYLLPKSMKKGVAGMCAYDSGNTAS